MQAKQLQSLLPFLLRSLSFTYLTLLLTLSIQAQTITRYVSTTGTNTDPISATSWATSTTNLQGAINAGASGGQVWIAAGTYKPTRNTDERNASFSMRNGITIYGGFVGNETLLSGRPTINPLVGQHSNTILSGDINDDGALAGNSYHVFFHVGVDSTAVMDGVVITGGNAETGSALRKRGAAMYNTVSSPTLTNCTIRGNRAERDGGGLFNTGDINTILTNCLLENNTAGEYGGALCNWSSGSALLINCILKNNSANDGGAVFNLHSGNSLTMTNCLLESNQAASQGGAIYFAVGTTLLTNCIMRANSASQGGALWIWGGNGNKLTNCTLQNNWATSQGGAIYADHDSNPLLINSIIWNNQAVASSFATESSSIRAQYSLFDAESFISGTGNLTTNASPFTGSTSAELMPCSPAINAGNPASTTAASGPYSDTALPTTDLDGNPRIVGGRVDIGAVEFQGTPFVGIISQLPATSIVCAGTAVSAPVSVSGTVSSYQWYKASSASPLANQNSATLSLPVVSTTDAGSYSLVVTGSCNSVTSTAFSLSVTNPPSNLNLTGGTLTCATTSLTLVASATDGTSYSLSNGQSNTNGQFVVNQLGSYTVTIGSGLPGCTASTTTTVISNTTAPSATLTNSGPITDTNPTVTLTAGGGNTYAFSSGTTQQSGPSGNTATVINPGSYSVTVTRSDNGCLATASTLITGATSQSSCRNGSAVITVVASGTPVKYEWYRNSISSARLTENPALVKGTSTASLTLVNQQVTANYYLRVTDQNGSAVVYGPFKMTVNLNCNIYARVGAEEIELKITVLGNPIQNEQLRATVQGAEGKALNVQLLDLSGRLVRSQQWQQAEREHAVEWSMSDQTSGVYLLQATADANDTTTVQQHSVKVIKP